MSRTVATSRPPCDKAREEALADALYRLTEMQGDLLALGQRDAAGLIAMAIGLVLESDPARVNTAPGHEARNTKCPRRGVSAEGSDKPSPLH